MFRVFVWVLAFFLFVGVASAVCEATGEGTCYYIDPVHGDDADDGSIDSPWRTFGQIVTYFNSSLRPNGWQALQPGDVVYLREGVHDTVIQTQTHATAIVHLQGISGTPEHPIRLRGFPGERPVIGDILEEPYTFGVYLLAANWWEVSNMEFRDTPGSCIEIGFSSDIDVFDVEVHGCARKDNGGNPAGLRMTEASRVNIWDSIFYDNFRDPILVGNPNIGFSGVGVQLFSGNNITVFNNEFSQRTRGRNLDGSPAQYASCMFQKHAQVREKSFLHVFNNTFINCENMAFGSGTQYTHFHHNVIIDGTRGVHVRNFGGNTHQAHHLYEFNTFVNSTGFTMQPSLCCSHQNLVDIYNDGPVNITFRNNIVVDNQVRDSTWVGTYMNDEAFDSTVPELSFAQNCYYNTAGQVTFDLGRATHHRPSGRGGQYSLSEWQSFTYNGATIGYDTGSVVANPLFVDQSTGDYRLQENSPCIGMGAFAQTGQSPSREGDVNNDGLVNLEDLLFVVSRLGLRTGDTGFEVSADLDANGRIDLFDLVIVARNFGA